MSKNFTTLIHRYPEKAVPDDLLRAVLKARSSAGGYAVQAMEKGEPLLVVDHMDVGVQLEAAQELLNQPEYKASHILLAFHQFEKFGEDDLQPYNYVVDGDAIDLAFGIEGDFPTMIEGDVHPETKLSKAIIIPNLNKIRKFSAGEIQAFMAELNDQTFKDMIEARIGNRGYLCFFPPIGEPVWLSKEKFGSSFPWGRVSNTHGYIETPATVTVPVEQKKTGWFTKKSGPTLPVAEDKPVTTPAETKPPLGLPGAKPDTKIDVPSTTPSSPVHQPEGTVVDLGNGLKGTWKALPPGLSGKDKKAMVRRVTNCGSVFPEGYEKPGWTYLQMEYPSRVRDLPELKEKLEQQQQGPAPTHGNEAVAEANLMVLTAHEKSEVESVILKVMDRQGKEIPSPLEIQKMVSKYPKFTTTFGVTFDQIDKWLPADIAKLAEDNGKAFFHLFLETLREKIEAKAALAAIANKPAESVSTTHQLAHDELKSEKKVANSGGWGKWKK